VGAPGVCGSPLGSSGNVLSRTVISFMIGLLPALAMLLAPTPGKAQIYDWGNEFVQLPSLPAPVAGYTFSGWNNFEMVFQGPVSVPTQDPTDGGVDPFVATGPSQINVSSDANGNTVVTFSGNAITPATQGFLYPHFGLIGPVSAPLLYQYWSGQQVNNSDPSIVNSIFSTVPTVNVVINGGVSNTTTSETVFVEYSQNGVVGGLWTEVPIVGSTPVMPIFTSGLADPADPIQFLLAGYMITATPIPLDALNLTFEPPPGFPGSQFTPMANPPDITTVLSPLNASPSVLWPPNKKMVSVSVAGPVGSTIISVSGSDTEAVPSSDWQITGPMTVNLRAQRDGDGDGRIYTILVLYADGVTENISQVQVPHDMGNN